MANQQLAVKIALQTKFGRIRKEEGPVITENNLQFKKILRFVNFQKKRNIVFNVITAISCLLKALDRLT